MRALLHLPQRDTPRAYPLIGSRYTPDHVVRFDSTTGVYEELNALASRAPKATDINTQRLLLTLTKAESKAKAKAERKAKANTTPESAP